MAENSHKSEEPERPSIAVIGGGTGCSTIVRSLKPHAEISAIVGMADDGGSTGVLRDQYGGLPPGDILQNLVALSDTSVEAQELLGYRFPEETVTGEGKSSLAGHSLGNIMLKAAENQRRSFESGLQLVSEILHVEGKVVPATLDNSRLVITTADGRKIYGEYNIGEDTEPDLRGCKIEFDGPTEINPKALDTIYDAEVIVIAPGDLYTSIAPVLVIDGMKKALEESRAKKIYVTNLVNKANHTVDFTVKDYVDELERIADFELLDYILYNTRRLPPDVEEAYEAESAYAVKLGELQLNSTESQERYIAIGGNFLSDAIAKPTENDRIKRSFVRHNLRTVASSILMIVHAERIGTPD